MFFSYSFFRASMVLFCTVCSSLFAQYDLSLNLNFDENKIVGHAGPINITAEEFYLSYEFGPAFIKKTVNSRSKHLNYMLNEKLLALDGYSRNIDTTKELASLISDFIDDISTEQLFKDSILSRVTIDKNETDEIVKKKLLVIDLRWLYSDKESVIREYEADLKKGVPFDSVFNWQLTGGILFDDRSLKSNIFQLETKNPVLAEIVHNIKVNKPSEPVYQDNGWYIIYIHNIEQNIVSSESEIQKLRQEAFNAQMKIEMDSLSDIFVSEIMLRNAPVIKRDAFKIIRSYLGKFYLPKEKYIEWELDDKLDETLGNIKEEDINKLPLVTLTGDEIIVEKFLNWFRNRSEYVKFNENSFAGFSNSLEQIIWRMVRDHLLGNLARKYDYNNHPDVLKQTGWWKDKIVGSAVRNEIAKSIDMESNETGAAGKDLRSEDLKIEFNKRMYQRLNSLRHQYQVNVFDEELNKIPVSSENDKKAIEFFTVKRGGLIPRTPYPTINNEWVNWE